MTEGLLDLLRKGADDFASPSRVVNMTALIESRGKPITDWSYPGKYSQMHAYADAKLLALMYTYAMARRHQGDGLTFNAVSPGTVNSGFGGKAGGTFKTIQALMKPFVGPPEKGSRGGVRLLADPDLATATGGYYTSAKLKKSSKRSRDHDAQDRVYEQTERELRIIQLRRPKPTIANTAGAATLDGMRRPGSVCVQIASRRLTAGVGSSRCSCSRSSR